MSDQESGGMDIEAPLLQEIHMYERAKAVTQNANSVECDEQQGIEMVENESFTDEEVLSDDDFSMEAKEDGSHEEESERPMNPKKNHELWLRSVAMSILGLTMTVAASLLPFVNVTTNENVENEGRAADESHVLRHHHSIAINPWFAGHELWKHQPSRSFTYCWILLRCLVNTSHILSAICILEMLAKFVVIHKTHETLWVGFRVHVPRALFCRYAMQMMRLCIVLYCSSIMFFLLTKEQQAQPGSVVMVIGMVSWARAAHYLAACIQASEAQSTPTHVVGSTMCDSDSTQRVSSTLLAAVAAGEGKKEDGPSLCEELLKHHRENPDKDRVEETTSTKEENHKQTDEVSVRSGPDNNH